MSDESKDPGTTTEAPEDTATAAAEPAGDDAKPKADEAGDEAKADEESKAEEPKSEEPKAEEPKAEEPKAEEPKAEEPKAEEPKAEEPKAEEPKADAKKDEPKKDEPKKDEPKADAKKEDKPKKKSEVKAKLEQAKSNKKKTRRIGEAEEEEKSAQEIFLENLPTIVVVALVFIIVPLLWTSRQQAQGSVTEKAWKALADAKNQKGTAPFAELVKNHKNTEALPYIKITWASRLYETGEKAKVEQARDLLKEVLRDNGDNEFIKRVVPGQIEKIEAELNNADTPWSAPKQAPIGDGDPDKALGPDGGHSDDDGHGHGKEKAPTPPKKTDAPPPAKKTADEPPPPPAKKTAAPPPAKKTADEPAPPPVPPAKKTG